MTRNLIFPIVLLSLASVLCAQAFASPVGRAGIDDYLIETEAELLNNGADYLIVSHNDFTEVLLPLADLRDAQEPEVR